MGAANSSALPLDINDVSTHLVEDWLPSLPVNIRHSLLSWPSFLLTEIPLEAYSVLALSELAGRSERQWKGFLSWMLGVAGTRHVLRREGYRWIAPLSAFYPDARTPVDLSEWPSSASPGSLLAYSSEDSGTRLRPDYIAIKFSAEGTDAATVPGEQLRKAQWAVAESKGTHKAVKQAATCPASWKRQVKNVSLYFGDEQFEPHRHIVIATRVNPNAKSPKTRRIQIRAWNSDERREAPSSSAVAQVVTAALYGLTKNLGLEHSATALALSARWRRGDPLNTAFRGPDESAPSSVNRQELERARQASRTELGESGGTAATRKVSVQTGSDRGNIEVELMPALVRLIDALCVATTDSFAAEAVARSEAELERWDAEEVFTDRRGRHRASPMGLLFRFPDEGRPRGET